MGRLDRLKEEILKDKKLEKGLTPVKRNPEIASVPSKTTFSDKQIGQIAAALQTLMKES